MFTAFTSVKVGYNPKVAYSPARLGSDRSCHDLAGLAADIQHVSS